MADTAVHEPRLSQVSAVSQDESKPQNNESHEASEDGRRRSYSPSSRHDLDLWARRVGALIVAAVAAYASYQHQREFALHGGADVTSAGLWPLSVDGLLVLATAGLLKSEQATSRRARYAMRLTFAVGIAVSLAANIASAPRLGWQPILVAGWPPVALLLAVELLAHRRPTLPAKADAASVVGSPDTGTEAQGENETVIKLGTSRNHDTPSYPYTAQEVMWEYYQREVADGRVPTGAQLDKVAGTNNYGRAVLRRWRREAHDGCTEAPATRLAP